MLGLDRSVNLLAFELAFCDDSELVPAIYPLIQPLWSTKKIPKKLHARPTKNLELNV
jgi:hypothetical protein